MVVVVGWVVITWWLLPKEIVSKSNQSATGNLCFAVTCCAVLCSVLWQVAYADGLSVLSGVLLEMRAIIELGLTWDNQVGRWRGGWVVRGCSEDACTVSTVSCQSPVCRSTSGTEGKSAAKFAGR